MDKGFPFWVTTPWPNRIFHLNAESCLISSWCTNNLVPGNCVAWLGPCKRVSQNCLHSAVSCNSWGQTKQTERLLESWEGRSFRYNQWFGQACRTALYGFQPWKNTISGVGLGGDRFLHGAPILQAVAYNKRLNRNYRRNNRHCVPCPTELG